MGRKDPRIDAYIARSADFARPILEHLRALVHSAVPDVEETMKWTFPHFDYKGEMMCSMAAFKRHCVFGFWKGALVLGEKARRDAMGHLGRIQSIADLPSDRTLSAYIRKAAKLNDDGVKAPRVVRRKPPLVVPPEFISALQKNKQALDAFDAFPPSHKREYVEWITDARTDATRERRMTTALQWIAEGKPRNWKYLQATAAAVLSRAGGDASSPARMRTQTGSAPPRSRRARRT